MIAFGTRNNVFEQRLRKHQSLVRFESGKEKLTL